MSGPTTGNLSTGNLSAGDILTGDILTGYTCLEHHAGKVAQIDYTFRPVADGTLARTLCEAVHVRTPSHNVRAIHHLSIAEKRAIETDIGLPLTQLSGSAKRTIGTSEAAQILGRARDTVRHYAQDGILPYVQEIPYAFSRPLVSNFAEHLRGGGKPSDWSAPAHT